MDGKTWQELAAMEKVHLRNGYIEYWFNQPTLQQAQAIVREAARRAEDRAPVSPGEVTAVSPGEIEAAAAE